MPAQAVIVAATNLTDGLRERLDTDGELLTFADTEPIQALQAILQQVPKLVVLERLFAATPRGAALINRIRQDPQLETVEVRVMSHSGDYVRNVTGTTSEDTGPSIEVVSASNETEALAPVPPPPDRQLDWHGTRRAPRFALRSGVRIQLDGNPVAVVDLSTIGAQVVSATILRPSQRVRVSVPTDNFVMRFRGLIAWAKFELPNPKEPPRYRAGVEFVDADAAAMGDYCERFRA
jgi:CheY-like chemotaxis protein